MSPPPAISGKVAFITGGSRGIGLAIAQRLVAEGARVAVTGRDEAALAAAQVAIGEAGAAEAMRADVRSYADVGRAIEATVARFGGLDIVVNNAGVGSFVEVADMAPDQWAEVIDTNLTGVFNTCHAAIPHLRRRGGGFIINISSLAGKNAFPGGAAYCASKSGLNAFSEALMQELRYDDIRVAYLMPGSVATGFSGGPATSGADWKIAPEDVADVVVGLLNADPRTLASRIELRPSKPRKR
jgi:NAD(P)-dependent dehydrogenase (short-subunit alcohol dehydrogenase family)